MFEPPSADSYGVEEVRSAAGQMTGRADQADQYGKGKAEPPPARGGKAEPPPARGGKAPWYAKATLARRIGVVIPTRNRADFLPHMLGALRMQVHRPERILVVDDGDDHAEQVVRRYPGVEYLRAGVGNGCSGNPARNVGLRTLSDLPYLCFLDDDDMIPPDYLEILLATIESDCRAAAAYPRLQFCGIRRDRWAHPYDPDLLGRTNISGVPALIRTDALLQVGGWPILAPDAGGALPGDDWALWRRLRDHGWRMIPAPVDYFYYRHEDVLCRSEARADHRKQWRRTVDPTNLVTLAVPWSGRLHLIDEVLGAIARQTFPAEHLHVLFYDNSGSEECGRRLRRWLLEHDRFAGHSYVRDPLPAVAGLAAAEVADAPLDDDRSPGRRRHARATNDRVAAVWNRIGRLARTDLVWCLEDDVIPTADALDRLLDRMAPDIDGVTANYRSRVVPGHSVAWEYTDLATGRHRHLPGGSGVGRIGGCGLGCALVRREVFGAGPARSAGEAVGYDGNLWLDVARRGGTLLIDWDLACDHRVAPPPAGRGAIA